ncbi:MAG: hypothetical protein GXO86_14260 [Chlorobi bacterium]|nr:hypothetical protein [Chlorobiota bacterium]
MNKINLTIILSFFLFSLLFVQEACKKKEDEVINDFTVNLPRYNMSHDVYYLVNPKDRSIELEFNKPLNPATVDGNLSFYDKSGALDDRYSLEVSGNMILLVFKSDFQLHDAWQYFIEISPGLKSADGQSLAGNATLEIRTLSYPLPSSDLIGADSTERNSIACISDLHLGDERANENNYCWFGKNKAALENFLDYVVNSHQFRKLVIMGDLFDEWLVPYTISPFDPQVNINSSSDYFHAVASNPVNTGIINRLKNIALNENIELVYIPGNHDMLLTREIMDEIIPHLTWAGKDETPGLGYYSPMEEIIMEHGHRYDFFNCPQSLVNPGHQLPPGYFVSRLYAQGMMDKGNVLKSANQTSGSFEFETAWTLAYLYTIAHFDMPLPQDDSANILMGGIDDYSNPMSFNGAKKMYAENIEELWPETQTKNKVPVPTECCFHAIWNGHSDLWSAAMTQYILQPPAPVTYKVIAFGHTHQPELKTYVAAGEILNVYANSGSWLDEDASDYKVRTFLTIKPAAWTGSQLDVVSLYQYNSSGTGQYKPVLLGEESVEAN